MKTYKPTSAGTRARKHIVHNVNRVRPEKSLTVELKGAVGRSHGRITSASRERGSKKLYRIVDYKRDKHNIPAVEKSIEYDPYRGPSIALLFYKDGEKRYILAPEGLKVGDTVMSGPTAEASVGSSLPISLIPLSVPIHNIEIMPGGGAKFVRTAGQSAQLLAKEGGYGIIKLPSGEVRKISENCYATVGVLGNFELRNSNLGKAGRNRYRGRRPHTRGVAMADPSDHPHAGSYKTTGIGMPGPKSPWGWPTKGFKTRRRQNTRKFIVTERRHG